MSGASQRNRADPVRQVTIPDKASRHSN
jgi:hypothetical protein